MGVVIKTETVLTERCLRSRKFFNLYWKSLHFFIGTFQFSYFYQLNLIEILLFSPSALQIFMDSEWYNILKISNGGCKYGQVGKRI